MKRVLLLMFVLMFSISFVFAQDCTIEIEDFSISPHVQNAKPGQTLTYNIAVKSSDNGCDITLPLELQMTYTLSEKNFEYKFVPESIDIGSGQTKEFILYVTPFEDSTEGSYPFSIKAWRSKTTGANYYISGEGSEDCLPKKYETKCYNRNSHWVDACGELGGLNKVCEIGCDNENGICIGDENFCGAIDCPPGFECFGGGCIEILQPTTERKGYRYASWECYDEESFRSEDDTSCKLPETWEKYAKEFCEDHCYEDGSKCGVNSYSISNECYYGDDSILILEPIDEDDYEGIEEAEIIEDFYLCKNSCPLDEKCYPFGYRKSGEFCSDKGSFIPQLDSEKSCDNNFECSSNLCIDSSCVDSGVWQKFLSWFSNLFG